MDMGRRKIIFSVCGIICVGIMGMIIYLFTFGGSTKPLKQDVKEYIVDMIAEDNPEIRKVSDELEYLHIIREWVFSKTMLAGTEDHYGEVWSADKGEPGTREYYDNMYEAWKREGYYCGGMAQYLTDIYTTLGYRSLILSMAFLDEEGSILDAHTVTLVQYKEKWIVEDATFNLSYADESGNALDVREIKKEWKIRKV